MEVRSNIEKCGGAATADSVTADTVSPAAEALASKSKKKNFETIEATTAQSKITANENTSEIMKSSAMTKDERLVADLKSQLPDIDKHFHIHHRIGEGTFSTVFMTSLRCHKDVPPNRRRFFALKYLVPTSHPKRIAQELRCLKEIGGKENVVGVDMCIRKNDAIAFVMPYMQHDRFPDYFDKFNARELQDYIRNLLIALKHVHSFGVIHRDVKPGNFLYDRKSRKYLLVDFGLAQTLDKEFESTKPLISRKNNNENTLVKEPHGGECDKHNSEQQQQRQQQQQQQHQQSERGQANIKSEANAAGYATAMDGTQKPMATADSIQLSGNANKIKRKASHVEDETETRSSKKENAIGAADAATSPQPETAPKRARTLASNNAVHVASTAMDENTVTSHYASDQLQQSVAMARPRDQYIPSPFKAPLKQHNEISTPNKSKFDMDSPLTRHIKTAVLEYSMRAKIMEKQRNGGTAGTNAANANANSVGIATAMTPSPTAGRPEPVKAKAESPMPAPPGHKYVVDNRRTSSSGPVKCYCYGRPVVCNVCIVKREIHATRAGTPGYRPTEVLLKYPDQTTAVDVWAAGVILISILSGCYPFFKGTDDMIALAEIMTVFGDETIKRTALTLGRRVCISRKKRPLHLRKLCLRLRNRNKMPNTPTDIDSTKLNEICDNCDQVNRECLCEHTDYNMDFSADTYPDEVYDLLAKLLAINPINRISAADALKHQFFNQN